MTSATQTKPVLPPQHQHRQPGLESDMNPLPVFEDDSYKPAGKLKDKVAIITGGDSGIGRAVAVAYAKEGADVVLLYLNEHQDATKGAIVAFTRSLSQQLVSRGIRVNGVAPGPVWTPLIPSTFTAEQVAVFGSDTPMQRPGQPKELAPSYVFLASEDTSYMTGQMLHVNGGVIVGS